jgi:3'-5' exoribonuclease
MAPAKIASLEDGDRITGFALLTRKELRQDRNGKDFIDLELADSSGRINGKVWSDSPALSGTYEPYDFVAYKGSVADFKGQLQLRVQECRRVTEADREYGFDEADVIPSTKEDLDDLWRRLEAAVESVASGPLRALAAAALHRHGARLREHPAAKVIHHAYRGGLLEHTVSMLELAVAICDHYKDLDRDLVLVGILFHDLGKLDEIGALPRNDYTTPGRLVGHVVLGRDLLLELAAEVPALAPEARLQLEHIVLSHQGRLEHRAAVEPMTAEALVVHFIDDLDSKLNQLRDLGGSGDEPQYLRGLGRWVYPLTGDERLPSPEENGEPVPGTETRRGDAEASSENAPAAPQSRLDL